MEALNGIPHEPLNERRQDPRLRCDTEARFRDLYKPHEIFLGSLVQNLSVGGLRIITPKFIPKESRLVAQVSLPGVASEPVRAICRVAWVRERPFSDGCECGLEFVEVSPESRDLMAGCIERGVQLHLRFHPGESRDFLEAFI